jgi:hypothetical protein
MKLKTVTFVSLLLVCLGFVAYLDSPYSFLNVNYSYTADQPAMAQPASIESSTELPVIKEKLEKSEKVDGYIIETYEEYEVYKDKDGNIIKSEPTGKTDSLKYWDYSKKDR